MYSVFLHRSDIGKCTDLLKLGKKKAKRKLQLFDAAKLELKTTMGTHQN